MYSDITEEEAGDLDTADIDNSSRGTTIRAIGYIAHCLVVAKNTEIRCHVYTILIVSSFC